MEPQTDDDPVIQSYNVFLQPSLVEGRRLLILQHPNRQWGVEKLANPTAVRLKRSVGMVEVDVPVDMERAYDRKKGQEWGSALHRSTVAKGGVSSHGLAGGFSVGAPPARARRDQESSDGLLDWNEAVRQDKVLHVSTLGGMASDRDEAQYLVGAFKGKNLHLTPTNAVINLRPQLHHIDAFAEQERRREAAAAIAAGDKPAGPGARAIHMTIKTDGNDVTIETMADRLKKVQTDKWVNLGYLDDEDESSWDVYDRNLLLHGHSSNKTAKLEKAANGDEEMEGVDGETREKKGKGKEVALPDDADAEDLVTKLPLLRVRGDQKDMLYAVSGRPKPVFNENVDDRRTKGKGKEPVRVKEDKAEPAKKVRKSAAAPRRGGKAASKTGSSLQNAVNVD